MDRETLMSIIINEFVAQAEHNPDESSAEYDGGGIIDLGGRFQVDELADCILRQLNTSAQRRKAHPLRR